MLASLLKEHQIRQQERRDVQELRRKRATEAIGKLTSALTDSLNDSVAIAYSNQKKIDAEAKRLQTNAATFAKQTSQWLKLMEEFNSALKEIGDVENWSKSIEADMRTVSTALEYVYKDGLAKK
ncbi:biogenesis of lysosome-related organelles complex 1 subunit 1-like [Watersipora subatra]|uniref:biogenesis of lysosome-related organelles complex 1 subunit 1-like n=1 Tax=Watersipora subatra TaxID=2589382 RepID=UPI00355C5ADE